VKREQFAELQKALAARFGGDPSVHDLPRVMRLPGFFHRKGAPFLTLIVSTNDAPAYTAADFSTTPDGEERNAFEVYSNTSKSPTQRLNDLALANLSAWVPEIFPGARPYHGGFRVSSADLGRELQEDLSIVPDGIKDFGVHDMDDPREGKRTPIELVMEHVFEVPVEEIASRENVTEFQQAFDWLRDRLPSVDEPMGDVPTAKGKEQTAKGKPTDRKAPEPVVVPVDLWAPSTAPPLPRDLLPKVIEDFARNQGELMGADPAGLAVGALTAIAAVIPDRIQLQPKEHEPHWKESARLWTALVGPVSAMKTPIMRMVDREVKRIDRELSRKYQAAMAAWKALSSEERAKTPEPLHTRLRVEDTTPEAMQEILKDSPDGVYCSRDELGGWFGAMDKYAGNRGAAADRGFWLSAYNGDDYAVDRIGRGSGVIEHLSVSILGGIQPEPARKLLDDGNDDGLLQRLIPIMLCPCDVGKDEPMSQAVDRYNDLVRSMYNRLQNSFFNDLKFTAEARAIRQRLEIKHRDLMQFPLYNRKLQAHIGKYNGLFARLCLIWHLIEHWSDAFPSDVDAHTAQRVARFMHEYLLPNAFAFYSEMTGLSADHDHLLAIAGYILAYGLTRVTNRDVQRGDGTMRRLGRQDLEKLFTTLDGCGWGDYVPGRRFTDPPSLTVNPEVHRRFARYAGQQREQRKRLREGVIAKATGEQK
jgi:Protein of unknown function (DUF3987)/RepB DNA-primase N-terminal domain